MSKLLFSLTISFSVLLLACSGSSECSESEAYNKMLALGRAQARIVAANPASSGEVAAGLTVESGAISELIAARKFQEACIRADAVAKKVGIDIAAEMKGMLTIEQLANDGGKGSGVCSLADAAQKQMQVHQLLQAQVDQGKASSDVFRKFNDDTAKFGELMYTDPSAVCQKLEELKKSYGL